MNRFKGPHPSEQSQEGPNDVWRIYSSDSRHGIGRNEQGIGGGRREGFRGDVERHRRRGYVIEDGPGRHENLGESQSARNRDVSWNRNGRLDHHRHHHQEGYPMQSQSSCHECGTRLVSDRGEGNYCPRCNGSFRRDEPDRRKRDRSPEHQEVATDSKWNQGGNINDNGNKRRRSSSILSQDGPMASRPYRPRERRRPRFPVPFELEPEEYVLDPITGYFYENRRHFYHCPKSKLYLHSESKSYFSFDRDEDAYMDVDFDYGAAKMKFDFGEKDTVLESDDLVVQALQGTKKAHDSSARNKISITIKQHMLPNKKSSSKKNSNKASKQQDVPVERAKDTVLVERRQKSHQDDIEKWTQRVKECNESKITPMSIDVPVHDNVEEQVSRTKSGKPVCMLCKRKFINMEKLEQHQLLSQLHKFNLGKLARANGGKHKTYLDRAYNRRVLYESQTVEPVLDVGEVGQLMAPNLEEARKVVVTETVRPEDNLGDTNIGNKMLQKLGWDGGSLGRKVSSDNQRGSEALKNEWKRIEALAKH